MRLTEEQVQVIESFRECEVLKVNAFAGTGKTTTLKELASVYRSHRFLYLAFNRSIAKEARRKFPRNTSVYTTHALAYRCVSSDIDLSEVRGDYRGKELMEILGIGDWRLAYIVAELFNFYCNSSYVQMNEETVRDMLRRDKRIYMLYLYYTSSGARDVDAEFLARLINEFWNMIESGRVPPTHNFYLKYFQLNLDRYLPELGVYDAVLLDEAQDTNEVTLDIFVRLPGRKVVVGDRHQQIYGFRRSINAMSRFPADRTLYLSTSFRITREIALRATAILHLFKSEKVPVRAVKNSQGLVNGTTAYVSRTNAVLVRKLDKLISDPQTANRVTTVRDPLEIFRLPLSVYYFRKYVEGEDRSLAEKIPEKWILQFASWDELKEYAEEAQDAELLSAIALVERSGVSVPAMFVEARRRYGNKDADIFLATAHTAKGLEWDKVILCEDFPFIPKLIAERTDSIYTFRNEALKGNPAINDIVEEINLYYVAVTRARDTLEDLTSNAQLHEYTLEGIDALLKKIRREETSGIAV